jgi:hypothetical protein
LDQKLALTAEGYSPRVVEKAVRQGSKSPSFAEASEDLAELAGIAISPKHLERLVERVGGEWADHRDQEVKAFVAGKLPRNYAQAPAVSAVMLDGGRVQTRAEQQPPGVHQAAWKETKVACCLTLCSTAGEQDPQPEPPAKFLDPPRVLKLVRQIKSRGACGDADPRKKKDKNKKDGKKKEPRQGAPNGEKKAGTHARKKGAKRKRPARRKKRRVQRLVRTAVATMADSGQFGWQVAAEVHRRGLDRAGRKACVCDGEHYNWSIFEMHLQPSGFIGILDFLHLLTYLYAAARAVAGKGAEETLKAWSLYERWLRQAWSGKSKQLLEELTQAGRKLGPPRAGADEQDPRRLIADAVTYVSNNLSRMDYPRYRKLGLPISSAPVESLIKQFNRRIKGTEKFWLKADVEAVLQVRAAYVSQDHRAEQNWSRPRPYQRAAGQRPPLKKAA